MVEAPLAAGGGPFAFLLPTVWVVDVVGAILGVTRVQPRARNGAAPLASARCRPCARSLSRTAPGKETGGLLSDRASFGAADEVGHGDMRICRSIVGQNRMHAGPQIDPKSVASLPLSMYAYAEPTGVGTGFVVLSDGVHLLLTNFHVLSGRHPDTLEQLPDVTAIPDRILLPVLVRGPRLVWRALVQQVLRDGEPLWVEHPNFGARFDVVALPLSLPGDTYVAHYSRDPGPKIAVTPASQVAIVGFPEGLSGAGITALWKSGAVASEVDPPLEAQEYFLIDANTRRGMSGSPVLARRDGTARMESGDTALHTNVVDRVLGVYAGRAFEAPDMTLGRVWKWSGVQELVDAAVLKVKSHALEPMRCYLGHHRAGGEDMVRLDLKKSVELTLRVGPAGTPQKRTFTVLELLRDIALMDDRFGRDLGRLRMAAAIEAACVSASADAGIVELSNEQHAVVREAIESPSKGYNPEAGRQLIPLIEYVLAPPQQSG